MIRYLVVSLLCTLLAVACARTPPESTDRDTEALAPALVQAESAVANSGKTVAVKLTKANLVGDTIVVAVGWNAASGSVHSVADSSHNVYALATGPTLSPAATVDVYYASGIKAASANANTVTVTLSASEPGVDVRVAEFSGAGSLDVAAGASANGNALSSPTVTTTTDGDLLVGAAYVSGCAGPQSPWSDAVGSPYCNDLEWLVAGSAGPYAAQFSTSDGSSWGLAQIVAFHPAGLGDAGGDGSADAIAEAEAGQDSAAEASQDASDGSGDATVEAEASVDAAAEAAVDAPSEATADATTDAPAESGAEAGQDATTDGGSLPTPSLVQYLGSTTRQSTTSTTNSVKFTPPNAVLAGNCLVLGVAHDSGSAFAATPITDNAGNAWPTAPAATSIDSNGQRDLAVFVLPNALPGVTTFTVHFAAAIFNFQYSLAEFDNIATTSPVSGSSSSSNVNAPNLSTGSFTPANNDANGGNLIWSYFYDDGGLGTGNSVTSFAPGAGFSLLDADIGWHDDLNLHHATEYAIQRTAAAINPSITATMSPAADPFVGLSVSLRVASSGTPAPSTGIRINALLHNTDETPSGDLTAQAPSSGNLIVLSTADPSEIGSVTDNKGNAYTQIPNDGSEPQTFVAANATTGNDLVLTLHLIGTSGMSWSIFDISGAAASPIDATGSMSDMNCSNMAVVTSAPAISPTGPGLTIACMGIGQGPGLGFASGSPSGAVFDMGTYSGETDSDSLENADCRGHVYNAGAESESWNWAITSNAGNSCAATAVHVLAR